jgi:hypothetical protein
MLLVCYAKGLFFHKQPFGVFMTRVSCLLFSWIMSQTVDKPKIIVYNKQRQLFKKQKW